MAGYAQSGELYFSLTPIDAIYGDRKEGIYKFEDKTKRLYYEAFSIFFYLESDSRNIHISFAHLNVNPSEYYKICKTNWNDEMEIKTVDSQTIESQTVYDLDAFFKTYSREQLIDWLNSLDVRNKKIYFFDRRDISTGKITLVQVKLIDYGRGY